MYNAKYIKQLTTKDVLYFINHSSVIKYMTKYSIVKTEFKPCFSESGKLLCICVIFTSKFENNNTTCFFDDFYFNIPEIMGINDEWFKFMQKRFGQEYINSHSQFLKTNDNERV